MLTLSQSPCASDLDLCCCYMLMLTLSQPLEQQAYTWTLTHYTQLQYWNLGCYTWPCVFQKNMLHWIKPPKVVYSLQTNTFSYNGKQKEVVIQSPHPLSTGVLGSQCAVWFVCFQFSSCWALLVCWVVSVQCDLYAFSSVFAGLCLLVCWVVNVQCDLYFSSAVAGLCLLVCWACVCSVVCMILVQLLLGSVCWCVHCVLVW